MAKLGEKPRKFLDESPYVGVVTTLREDGSPHATIVWVDVEGDKVSFNTARGRAKPRHLEHDPRASLLMVDPDDAFRWVAVSGRGADGRGCRRPDRQAREEIPRQGRISVAKPGGDQGQGADRAREGRRHRFRRIG